MNIKASYKRNGLQGWLFHWLLQLSRLKLKNVILMNGIANQYKNYVTNEMVPKVGCFAGFCHHHLVTMSAHTHVYRRPLFESAGL